RALHARELFELERDLVHADRQTGNLISTVAIAYGDTHLLDQLRTGHFHRHAWHDSTLAVSNGSRDDSRLGKGQRRAQKQYQRNEQKPRRSFRSAHPTSHEVGRTIIERRMNGWARAHSPSGCDVVGVDTGRPALPGPASQRPGLGLVQSPPECGAAGEYLSP